MLDDLLPTFTLYGSSAFGALTYAALRPNQVWWGWIIKLVIGTGCGVIFAPLICDWQDWHSLHARNGVAAGVGLMGVTCCRAVVDAAEAEATKVALQWLKKWLRKNFGLPPTNGDEH